MSGFWMLWGFWMLFVVVSFLFLGGHSGQTLPLSTVQQPRESTAPLNAVGSSALVWSTCLFLWLPLIIILLPLLKEETSVMKNSREKWPLIWYKRNYSNAAFTRDASELKVEGKFKTFMFLSFWEHKIQANGLALDARFLKELALIN